MKPTRMTRQKPVEFGICPRCKSKDIEEIGMGEETYIHCNKCGYSAHLNRTTNRWEETK